MSVNLSIKNVPEEIAKKLRQQAKANHRSLQGELLALLKNAVDSPSKINAAELMQLVRESGLRSPRTAAAMIRADCDGR